MNGSVGDHEKSAFLRKISMSKSRRILNGLECLKREDIDRLVEMVKEDPDIVNARGGPRNGTLLHRCARNNRPKMVQFLLENGAEQKLDVHGNYPLHYASISGNKDIARSLLTKKFDLLEARNFEGEKPVHLAASCGNLEMLLYLLDQGSKGGDGYNGNTILHSAAEKCQLHVLEKLVDLGYDVNAVNTQGETPIHLAAGHRSGRQCVLFLLRSGADISVMTKSGAGAAHYAADTGSAEIMKYLVEHGAPLGARTDDDNSSSLLRLVALSGCKKKGSYLLDKMMRAKNKLNRCNNLADVCKISHGSYVDQEMSDQETSLIMMTQELAQDPDNINSVFRTLLDNNPESLITLFDRCLIYEDQQKSVDSNVVFDFFLFKTSGSTKNELDLIEIIFSTGRRKLLEHPLFEIFIRLKWEQSKYLFSMFFMIFLSHFISILGFALSNFSLNEEVRNLACIFKRSLFITTTLFLMVELTVICYILHSMYEDRKHKCTMRNLRESRKVWEIVNVVFATITALCGVGVLVTEDRNLTAVSLILTSNIFMAAVTSIPRIGKNVFITTQVTVTIFEFLFSYSGELIAFIVAFHILLPESEAFRFA